MNIRQMRQGVGVLIAAMLVLGACGGGLATGLPTPAKTNESLAGNYVASGANGANPQMMALITAFSQLHPGVKFQLNDTDTETSIVNVNTGDVDFGYIGRDLRPTDPTKITLTAIGTSGSAMVVNSANPITNLTRDQVAKLYGGQIKDWSEVGSTAGPVRAFRREAASTTRTTIESYVWGAATPAYSADVQEIFESVDTIKAIGAFKGSIGTVTLSARNLKDTTMKLIGMDGVEPTLANLNKDVWKMSKVSYMTTSGDPAKVKPAIKALLDFVKSPAGQKIITGQ